MTERGWQRLARDWQRQRQRTPALRLLFSRGFSCALLHRASHACYRRDWRRPARWFWLWNMYLNGADISPASQLGGGLDIPAPAGVAIHCRAGRNLTVLPLGGIGPALPQEGYEPAIEAAPQLGDNVRIGSHAGAYGAISVGSGTTVMPGCILRESCDADTTFLPPRLRQQQATPAEGAQT